MKIYKPIGSKERFVEVFQRVNKVKLNENLMEVGSPNLNPENVLNVAFGQLKNSQLKIEHSNTQEKGDENFVELLCTDNQGNNITFIFRAASSEGDQEGVYNISNVLLNSFSFDSPDGQDTLDLDENGLKQFNAQHAQEMMDVIDKYVDVANPETAELEEAVKLIDAIRQDSYPFGGGNDRLQTGKNYGDRKPTNDKVRVSSPELDKFIQEEINSVAGGVNPVAPVGKKITTKEELRAYVEQKKAQGDYKGIPKEDIPLLAGQVLYDFAVRRADKMLGMMSWDDLGDVNSMWDYIKQNGGMTSEQLNSAVKRAVNVRLKEEGYSLKDLGLGEELQEFDKPAQKLIIPPAVHENEDDDVVGQEVNRFKQEIQPQNPEEVGVDDEPVPEQSPERKDKILVAYDNLTARNKQGYSPTTAEVMAELDKMSGKVTKKTPRPPINFDDYVVDENSEQSKQSIIMQAAKKVAEDLKRTGKPYIYEEFIPLVKEEALNLYNNMQRMSLAEGENIHYPDPLGKEFKPKEHFPKQKKKRSKKVKIAEQEEVYGDEDISGLPEVPSGAEAEKQARSDIYKDPDYNRRGFNEDGKEKPETDDDMSHEPEGDEIEQIAQDKEETGEVIPGGNSDGKSPSEFNPDQILLGMKVEMEHSDDPMYALEITMDHLAEDPEYYTSKEDPEASAQFGAAKDSGSEDSEDKEMTDLLLGFEPHNVGDEVQDTSRKPRMTELKESAKPEDKKKVDTKGNDTKASTDTASDTSTETSTKTSTSTEAYTQGNITITGGAGAGDTHVTIQGQLAKPTTKTGTSKVGTVNPKKVNESDEDGNELGESVNKSSEKFSTLEKNKNGMTYLFAYPDVQGVETRDGLDSWESQDRANRQLQFVGSKEEAASTSNTFGESKKAKPVITEEQIKTAKMTLNRNIPTGMTKKEAVTILMNNNLRKIL